MAVPPNLQDPFHRDLRAQLEEHLQDRYERLINSGATQLPMESTTTAEKYAAQCAYIHAVQEVIKICNQLEQDRFGRKLEDD